MKFDSFAEHLYHFILEQSKCCSPKRDEEENENPIHRPRYLSLF